MDHRVKKVIALMKEYFHRGWPADRWARFVNLSPSRLHQLFKDETGLPPARYLRLLRMEQAKELLESTYLSVKEVMARVGLADESHFVRDFKRSYGCSPAKYRARFRDEQNNGGPPQTSAPVPLLVVTYPEPKQAPRASSVPDARPPSPLLLRRASHPRHLAQDEAPLLRARKKRELLLLMRLRHLAFADLTARITDSLARGLSKKRSIFYRPRRSSLPRRPPPSHPGNSASTAQRPDPTPRRPGK
jgi:AraC-like DNA-binding protein